MPAGSARVLVCDPHDTVVGHVHRLHRPDRGRVVVIAPPGGEADEVAESLLVAVGKRPHLAPPPRDYLWPLSQVWLQAEGINQLLVLDAHQLEHTTALIALRELCQRVHAQLWLVVPFSHRPPDALERVCDGQAPVESLTGSVTKGDTHEGHEPLPLSEAHFSVFADVTRQRLPARRRRAFDARWDEACVEASWVLPGHVDARNVTAAITTMLSAASTVTLAAIAFRAIQVMAFKRRCHVEDESGQRLLVVAEQLRRRATDATQTALARAHALPSAAAVGAIWRSTSRTIADLLALKREDVSADGLKIRTPQRALAIPSPVAACLRAALLHHTAVATRPQSPLLIEYRGTPMTRAHIKAAIAWVDGVEDRLETSFLGECGVSVERIRGI